MGRRVSERVFLALGANLGDRAANMREALRRIGARCRVVAVSSLYESAAVVDEGAPPGPDYLNAACEVEPSLPPEDLLRLAKSIERDLGRAPGGHWEARPIDIDILLYGARVIDAPDLVVPHPRMAERAFVLAPLAEIAPEAALPPLGATVGDLLADADLTGLRHAEGPEWAADAAPPASGAR